MRSQILRLQAQLAGRVEECRHPLLHLGKAFRIQIHPVGVGGQLAGGLVDLDDGGIHQLGSVLQGRVDLGQGAQAPLQAAQAAGNGILVALQCIGQRIRPGQQVMGVRQPLLLGRQGLPFARCQPKLRQLVDLPLQPLDADGFLARTAACRFQRPGRLLPALPALGQIGQ